MNNGPPTPPPSSATEIEDAARAQAQSALPETPATPATDPEPPVVSTSDSDMPVQVNVYHNMLPALCDLAEEGNFKGLVLKAELADLNVKSTLSPPFFVVSRDASQADNDQHPSRLLLTTPLVLSYLILDDLYAALLHSIGHSDSYALGSLRASL
jgi:COP9 signalosome complex subunit 8